ncbi:MAG: S-layer glycoprotein N-glycosyltransferase AglJ [Halobacteriales archaeon]
MTDHGDVCVLIPTLNEAETIGDVIDRFRSEGFKDILVIDGDSNDGTREIAAEHGADVIRQTGSGKGQAVREALREITASYVLLVDGDGTYRPEDAEKILEPLYAGRSDHVIGNRFADMAPDAMSGLNRIGNRLINAAFRRIHGRDFKDILSGYRAFTLESIEQFRFTAQGFGIETELAVECVKNDITTEIVPIRYEARPGGSETNLRPFRDGGVILLTLYRLAKTSNPLFYFGAFGVIIGSIGGAVGLFVVVEWLTQNQSHELLAIIAVFAVLFGVQLLIFGILSDMILALHREQLRWFD